MKLSFSYLIVVTLFSISCGVLFGQETSKLFLDYKSNPSKSILPNFSFVGYHNGDIGIPENKQLKQFNVLDFGAIPNDDISDRKAIQAAIDAASKNGGGVVFFPKGRFLVNEDGDDHQTSIVIPSSNIILRGSGSGNDGTEIFMKNILIPDDTLSVKWKSLAMLSIKGNGKDVGLGAISSSAKKGESVIVLKNSSNLIKDGDWVLLRLKNNSPQLIKNELGIHEADSSWTSLVKDGVTVRMVYQLNRVDGNVLQLQSPLAYEVNPQYGWSVYKINPIEEIGVEHIAFVGNWKEKFVHHRSWKDDSGFRLVNLDNTVNDWVVDCRFTDACAGLTMGKSANVSVLDCSITGNPGHEAISNTGGTNILIGNVNDKAGMWHSVGVASTSINTVIWRCTYPSNTSFESHASQPRNTLLDAVEGGLLKNHCGGAVFNLPNHLSNLVLWNFHQTNQATGAFNFWPDSKPQILIAMPLVIGFRGGNTFINEQLKYEESTGKVVSPASLYEAQLELRLGKLPDWIKKYNSESKNSNN